jgi:hypothetical protein
MGRVRKYAGVDPFIRSDSFTTIDNKVVNQGDFIKIKGIWGTEFKFLNFVTNPKTETSWIDCIQLEKGIGCGMRSFYPDRVKVKLKESKRGKKRRPHKSY